MIVQSIHGLKYLINDENAKSETFLNNRNKIERIIETAEVLPQMFGLIGFLTALFTYQSRSTCIIAGVIGYIIGFIGSYSVSISKILSPIGAIFERLVAFLLHYVAIILLSILYLHDWKASLYIVATMVLSFVLTPVASYEKREFFNNRVVSSFSSKKVDIPDVEVEYDVPGGAITDTWSQIIKNINDGSYKDRYRIGDTKTLDLGPEGNVEMQIAAFDTDELADGSGFAAITWISKQLLNTEHRMNPDNEYNSSKETYTLGTGGIGGWKHSEMRDWLKSDIKPLIPPTVRNAIKFVKKYSTSCNVSNQLVEDELTNDDVWIPSVREIFGDTSNYESKGASYVGLYSSSDDRIKKKIDSSDDSDWWLRSADYVLCFVGVSNLGYCINYYYYAELEKGVVLGFCL